MFPSKPIKITLILSDFFLYFLLFNSNFNQIDSKSSLN
jgi:hypothetical protein